jgi:hypothetical protein
MGFITERVKSLISKKVAAVSIGLVLVDTWPQAAVIVAYLLAQAWSDALKDQRLA